MEESPVTKDEAQRIAKLKGYDVLDTLPEKLYDDISAIASYICDTPVALISLIDKDRQWFKSKVGLDAEQTPRSVAFCAHAIHSHDLFYVPDATKDKRFHDNPLVTGEPKVIFYAGAPIVTPEGHSMGTLCVIDSKPRELNDVQKNMLTRLSNQVASNLELRLQLKNIKKINEELEQFSYRTSHDLKSPISSSKRLTNYIVSDIDANNLEEAKYNTLKVNDLMTGLESLVEDILSLVKADTNTDKAELINISEVIKGLEQRLSFLADEHQCEIITSIDDSLTISIERGRISQIIENLLSNGIKYFDSHNSNSFVKIKASYTESALQLTVEDNGVGIPARFKKDVYKMFTRFNPELSFGSGLGMSIVKKHVDYLNGEITFTSSREGTIFNVTIPTNTKTA